MDQGIIQLYPSPSQQRDLEGTYLAHDLRQYARNTHEPYIYANFVSSIDGRIAIRRPRGKGMMVPKDTSNPRDWRLYQELAAQSDLILSTGRYLRDWAQGKAQEILQTDNPKFADLRAWRVAQGLKPHPDIAIISASLDFPLPKVLTENGRQAVFITTAKPNPKRVRELEKVGRVIVAGQKRVSGKLLKQRIKDLGYQTVYSGAGPQVLHLLLVGDVLDRLYMTFANRILGGGEFDTIVSGGLLNPAANLKTSSIYFDPFGLDGLGQLFVSYNRAQEY